MLTWSRASLVVALLLAGPNGIARAEAPDPPPPDSRITVHPLGADAEDPPPLPTHIHLISIDPLAMLFVDPWPHERAELGPSYRDRGIPVCRMPCGGRLTSPLRRSYHVERGTEPLFRSPSFVLGPSEGDVTVKLGDRGELRAGTALVAVGGALTGAGGFVFLIGLIFRGSPGEDPAQNNKMVAPAALVAAGGIATLVAGVVYRGQAKERFEVIPGKVHASIGTKGVGLQF